MTLRRWHRLLGLVVGIPCLLWAVSGVILSFKNWERGSAPPAAAPPLAKRPFAIPVGEALARLGRSEVPTAVEWRHVLGAPRYLVRYAKQPGSALPPVVLIDGESGEPLPRVDGQPFQIDAGTAQQIAQQQAAVGVAAQAVTLETEPSIYYMSGMEFPIYRVRLSTGDDSYVSPQSGELYYTASRRFRLIRFAFYRLHVFRFDFAPRGSFLFLLGLALLLLVSALTGLWLALRPRGPTKARRPPAQPPSATG